MNSFAIIQPSILGNSVKKINLKYEQNRRGSYSKTVKAGLKFA